LLQLALSGWALIQWARFVPGRFLALVIQWGEQLQIDPAIVVPHMVDVVNLHVVGDAPGLHGPDDPMLRVAPIIKTYPQVAFSAGADRPLCTVRVRGVLPVQIPSVWVVVEHVAKPLGWGEVMFVHGLIILHVRLLWVFYFFRVVLYAV